MVEERKKITEELVIGGLHQLMVVEVVHMLMTLRAHHQLMVLLSLNGTSCFIVSIL